jgi:hypothetical protein
MYTPTHLKLWTHPDNYGGAVWPNFYSSGFGQSRDSDALERSNFAVAWKRISAVSQCEETQVVRESHWAVGWVEWIAIHADDTAALKVADGLREDVEQYPVLDDDHFTETEQEEADEIWANCYSVKERIRYIREHNQDWDFHNLADLLGCVRGKYFAGYASELIR